MRRPLLLTPFLVLALAACGASSAQKISLRGDTVRSCPQAWQASWQRLANRIHTPVYCPSWLPDPLTGLIGGEWNIIDVVSPDRSYLMGFAWQEHGEEIHVNLRAYPGLTRVPTCRSVELVGGKKVEKAVPCFADSRGQKTVGGIRVTEYTVNQDADQWHVLYAWTRGGNLYTLSEHVAPPLAFPKVVQYLNRMMGSLVLVRPR